MWSPVTKKMHFPCVKQFDKPKFEAIRDRLFALKAFTYIDRFSLKMSRRGRKISQKNATVGVVTVAVWE